MLNQTGLGGHKPSGLRVKTGTVQASAPKWFQIPWWVIIVKDSSEIGAQIARSGKSRTYFSNHSWTDIKVVLEPGNQWATSGSCSGVKQPNEALHSSHKQVWISYSVIRVILLKKTQKSVFNLNWMVFTSLSESGKNWWNEPWLRLDLFSVLQLKLNIF